MWIIVPLSGTTSLSIENGLWVRSDALIVCLSICYRQKTRKIPLSGAIKSIFIGSIYSGCNSTEKLIDQVVCLLVPKNDSLFLAYVLENTVIQYWSTRRYYPDDQH
jgi:hypothetical protein